MTKINDEMTIAYLEAHPEAKTALEDAKTADVVILHINDVYELAAVNEGKQGGMENAATLVKLFADKDPIVTFGGDALNSGTFSPITKGMDMIGGFNALGMDVAVIGNHEFDDSMQSAEAAFAASTFQWLGANLSNPEGKPVSPHISPSVILERNGHRIGFTGLVADWEADGSLAKGKLGPYTYEDEVLAAEKQARLLKEEQKTDIEIAICHGRRDDEIVSQTGIDIVLGGHEHEPANKKIGDDLVIRAGSDLENLSVVTIRFKENGASEIHGYNLPIIPHEIPDDTEMSAYVTGFDAQMAPYKRVIGESTVALDGRKEAVRTQGTNLGNLVADAVKDYMGADLALINGGGLRSDEIHAPGPVTVLDTMNILPFPNKIVTLELTGAQVREAVENGISLAPKSNGSFPQISGFEVRYDLTRPAGSRVTSLTIGGAEISPDQVYRLATYDFLADGNGGFEVFKQAKSRVNDPKDLMVREVFAVYVEKSKQINASIDAPRLLAE